MQCNVIIPLILIIDRITMHGILLQYNHQYIPHIIAELPLLAMFEYWEVCHLTVMQVCYIAYSIYGKCLNLFL